MPTVQVKETCAWWEGLVHMQGVWRCYTMVTGVLCAIMAGAGKMRKWSVVNWAMAELWLHLIMLLLEREVVQFGTENCAAGAVKPASLSVPIVDLGCIPVTTVKMQE